MRKEFKKNRDYYNSDEFDKKFQIKSFKKSKKNKNQMKHLVHSGDEIDDEYLEQMDEFDKET